MSDYPDPEVDVMKLNRDEQLAARSIQVEIAKTANSMVGEDTFAWKDKKKVFGGMCTQFVCDVFNKAGIELPKNKDGTDMQNANNMIEALKNDPKWQIIDSETKIQKGDIIFVKGSGYSGKHAMVATEDYHKEKYGIGEITYAHDPGENSKISIGKRNRVQLEEGQKDEWKIGFRYIP
jgi:cell wall-associated NlpC family hydrolase